MSFVYTLTIYSDTSLLRVTALLVTRRAYVKTTVLFFHPLDG